jgi:hypothetical protein
VRVAVLITVLATYLGAPSRAALAQPTAAPSVGASATGNGGGYWTVQRDGRVSAFGNAHNFGNASAQDIVGIAPTRSGRGYWVATADGVVLPYGDAAPYGTLSRLTLAKPIVGITPTPSGDGYWLVASDGGVFSFGDARFHGSTGALKLAAPIVGMATTKSGKGYWLVALDGGVFSFGDARFYGSTANVHLRAPIAGMTRTRRGNGYRLVAWDGGVFGFGDARFYGSMGSHPLRAPVMHLATTPDDHGYWEFAVDGGVFSFGDAPFLGAAPHALGTVRDAQPFVFPFQNPAQASPPGSWRPDQGIDMFMADHGASECGAGQRLGPGLVAVASGTIAGEGISGFGPWAPILHVDQGPLTGMYVYYGHTAGDLVPVGTHVSQGQPITHIGCGIVGRSDTPHLEIGMYGSYPGVPPWGTTSHEMERWLISSLKR